jgi:hypothetical protein
MEQTKKDLIIVMQIVKSLIEMNEYDKAIGMLELCLQSNNNED